MIEVGPSFVSALFLTISYSWHFLYLIPAMIMNTPLAYFIGTLLSIPFRIVYMLTDPLYHDPLYDWWLFRGWS